MIAEGNISTYNLYACACTPGSLNFNVLLKCEPREMLGRYEPRHLGVAFMVISRVRRICIVFFKMDQRLFTHASLFNYMQVYKTMMFPQLIC